MMKYRRGNLFLTVIVFLLLTMSIGSLSTLTVSNKTDSYEKAKQAGTSIPTLHSQTSVQMLFATTLKVKQFASTRQMSTILTALWAVMVARAFKRSKSPSPFTRTLSKSSRKAMPADKVYSLRLSPVNQTHGGTPLSMRQMHSLMQAYLIATH